MLRVILVTAPEDAPQVQVLAEHLRHTPLSAVYAAPACQSAAEAIARPHALQVAADTRLEAGSGALALIEGVAEASEGTIAAVVGEDVARAVVMHALEAPVADGRLAFDPGGYAEIEVRLDAPWTVNRLNERCYDDPDGARGIVRT